MLRRLQIEIVNVCNYRCPLCRTLLRDGVKRRRMRRDELGRILEPVAGTLASLTLYGTRGEPFMHPDLEGCVADAKRITGATIDISTNGSLVDRDRAARILASGVDRIIVAIDGLREDSYARYRVGGHLAEVLENLRGLCEEKRRGGHPTKIVLQLIPMATNEAEIDDLPRLGRELGVDEVRLKLSASVTRDRKLRPSERYRAETRREGRQCPFGLDKLYVDPNGEVYPCCYGEGHEAMRIGNAFQHDLLTLYETALPRTIRAAFAGAGPSHPFCDRCTRAPASRKIRLPLA